MVHDSITATQLPPPPPDFFDWFPYHWHWISKSRSDRRWRTETAYPIQPANLWALWRDCEQLIGVRFGETTRYAMLDIDRGSPYHPANDPAALGRIRAALEKIGIYRSLLVRSSESMGLHLYLPLSEAVPTHPLAQSIAYALKSDGLRIAAGVLESFPNAKRYRPEEPSDYSAHRLPLQAGSFLINDDNDPISDDIEFFLNALEICSNSNDLDELFTSFETAKQFEFKERFTATGEPKGQRGKAWMEDCERVIFTGWTAHHQTNGILGAIAQYGRVFKALADEHLSRFILETATSCPGYEKFCRHQHEIEQRCKDWASAAQKAYTPYAGNKLGNAWKEQRERASNPHNERQSKNAIDRIKSAIENFGDRIFSSVREFVRFMVDSVGCSVRTLYGCKSLWIDRIGGNAQNKPVEQDSAIQSEQVAEGNESIEVKPQGVLPPKGDYEGVDPRKGAKIFNRSITSTAVERPGDPLDSEFLQSPPEKPVPKAIERVIDGSSSRIDAITQNAESGMQNAH